MHRKRPESIHRSLAARVLSGLMLGLMLVPAAYAAPVLYGGLGGHNISSGPQASTNDGSLVIVSQVNGSTTVVGKPAGVARQSGIAFGLDGVLFGATQEAGGFPPPPVPTSTSALIRINPDTGALLSTVPITEGGAGIAIADLAVHPKTGALYGIRGPNDQRAGQGRLYVINTTSGAATLVGNTNAYFASIAFAPDGTLYMAAADLAGGPADPYLSTVNPSTAQVLTTVRTARFYRSLAVRPTDGVLFAGTGDEQGVFTINPATGVDTFIGDTGRNLVGGLSFRPEAGQPAAFELNQHGVSGSYFEPATSGQGVEVEIFVNAAGPGIAVVQVSWFTFDATVVGGPERQRWYTLGGTVASGAASIELVIYQNVGGNFDAGPVTAATKVGTATLRFSACDHGTLDYNFTDGSGRTGSIELTRLTKNVTCVSSGVPPVNADFAFSGNYYDPATSGQGITAEINPLSSVAFFAWYTYAKAVAAAGAAGQRWYTGQSSYAPGARTLTMTIYETTGGLFDLPTTPAPGTIAVGTVTLTFLSCTTATLTYSFTGGGNAGSAGSIALQRVGPVPAGCAM